MRALRVAFEDAVFSFLLAGKELAGIEPIQICSSHGTMSDDERLRRCAFSNYRNEIS